VRPAPDKTGAVIIDHAGCSLHHGLYDDPVLWSLSGARPKDPEGPLVRPCPFCAAVIPLAVRCCPVCGQLVVAPGSERSDVPFLRRDRLEPLEVGSLQWLATAPYEAVVQWAGGDEQRLRQIQWMRGYGEYWVTARQRDWGRTMPSSEV
jgi:hypothetical protein